MLRRTIFLTLAALGVFFEGRGQCLAPFQDINNFSYVFDAGESKYLESLPLLSYKVGRNNIMAYIAPNGRLKAYYKGRIYTITDNTPNYYMTDNWFLYQNFNVIKVLYNGEFKSLENQFRPGTDSLYYSDSLVVWTNALGELNVFYNGQTQTIERTDIRRAKISQNIFAYMDQGGNFKVFYQGQVQTLETFEPTNYVPGQNVMIYFDQYNNLKYFRNGQVEETSTPAPAEYRVGKDFVAYISQLKQLVVYYNGEETVLMDDHPLKWTVHKNMLVYEDNGNNFWCWYNGKKYWLERFLPQSYKVDNDIVVYKDLDGRLQALYYGEQVEVSDQIVSDYNLYNEAVTYSLHPYETTVWCNKKRYLFK
ncbi:MAG TPA: hypothetical protein VG603_09580 [Chitinophagales bacterium]|nr:hypothetical protein [Chitinophagales bacterium]